MGRIKLNDSEGNALAQANFGADVVSLEVRPQGDDIRLEEYENDGYILPLEIADARRQLEKVLNKMTRSSGGPLGLGGYGGTTKLFVKPSMILSSAPSEIPDCHTMRVKVELEETYNVCESSFLIFRSCHEKKEYKEVEMWMQWKDGRIHLSQWPEAPTCPVEPTPPPALEVPQGEPIAANPLWESLLQFLDKPIASTISAFFSFLS